VPPTGRGLYRGHDLGQLLAWLADSGHAGYYETALARHHPGRRQDHSHQLSTLDPLTLFIRSWQAATAAPELQNMTQQPQPQVPYDPESFAQIGVLETWRQYAHQLSWGRGQCLALLDDGCDLTVPEWQAPLPWGAKVIATHNSIDGNDDPTPVPPGYHGTSVGFPSSLNHNGVLGIAYANQVAQVRCVSIVHLVEDESATMAAALRWVANHHEEYGITAVNLSPLDDQRHREPVPTQIDAALQELRALDVWVSAPCGNNGYTDGISWPACQPECFAIGATRPGSREAHLDRWQNTDLLVAARATSSSNAYAAACAQVLREAMNVAKLDWKQHGATLPEATMAVFQQTGRQVADAASGCTFAELDLQAAVRFVMTG
jgi:hypothetical protein